MARIERPTISVDLGTARADCVTVNALALLQLAARRHGRRLRIRGARKELRELVSFFGLGDVLRTDDFEPSRPSMNTHGLKPGGETDADDRAGRNT
jgi:anti-anti-sigma regulatory factor